jgi:hypothetical protein
MRPEAGDIRLETGAADAGGRQRSIDSPNACE